MDFQVISAIIFCIGMLVFLFVKRKSIERQGFFPFLYFSLYRTQLGLKAMDRIAGRFQKLVHVLGVIGIVFGFVGMAFIAYSFASGAYQIILGTAKTATAGLVLPFRVKGAFYVPFFYWILSIFLLAIVHEFSHGVVARSHKLKVTSSGFAFLNVLVPIIPAAFVEPDEKELRKRPAIQQMSVFAAGPFSNFLFAVVVFAIMLFVMAPVTDAIVHYNGVLVTGFHEGNESFPAEAAGMTANELIVGIDGTPIDTLENFTAILDSRVSGDTVLITTNRTSYDITLTEHPDNASIGYLGVFVQQNNEIQPAVVARYGRILPEAFLWLVGLFYWLYVLNLGIGLFNLVPLGPIDGGRMLQVGLEKYFKKPLANKIWLGISYLFIIIIAINLIFAFF